MYFTFANDFSSSSSTVQVYVNISFPVATHKSFFYPDLFSPDQQYEYMVQYMYMYMYVFDVLFTHQQYFINSIQNLKYPMMNGQLQRKESLFTCIPSYSPYKDIR